VAVAKRTRAGATSAASRSEAVATTFTKIAPARAAQLFRWNRILSVLHAVQAIVIVVISPTAAAVRFEGTYPVSSIVNGQFAGLTSAKELLFSFPLAYLVAAFFGLSALAHFLVAYPLRERYEGWLAQQFNPMRWAEYALSSTLMIIGIASLSFITDAGALIAIGVCNASMNLFGWSMEEANIGRKKVQWSHYIFGCIAGIAPWIALFTSVGLSLAHWPTGVGPNGRSLEEFKPVLIAIYASIFVSFNIFALNMVLQRLKVGRWKDYLHGERSYMILSLVAKTLLAWQVWTGVFMPAN
jgi:hypothetical protein